MKLVCDACERPLSSDAVACAGCVRDSERRRMRSELEAYRRRLQPAVVTNARNHAHWALVSAVESLRVALDAAGEAELQSELLSRAYQSASAAVRALGRVERTA